MKIMICHDGSQNAQEALNRTIKMFKPLRPEVILITVVEASRDASPESNEIFMRWRNERHASLLKTAESITNEGLEVDALLAEGDPRETILEATENKKPDILVVGKRGGGGLSRMVLGSVSAFLIRHAQYPVLVFHHEEGC